MGAGAPTADLQAPAAPAPGVIRWMYCARHPETERFYWWAPHEGLKLVSPKRHRHLAICAIWFGTFEELAPAERRDRRTHVSRRSKTRVRQARRDTDGTREAPMRGAGVPASVGAQPGDAATRSASPANVSPDGQTGEGADAGPAERPPAPEQSDEGAGATPVAGSGAATADHRYAPAPGELGGAE